MHQSQGQAFPPSAGASGSGPPAPLPVTAQVQTVLSVQDMGSAGVASAARGERPQALLVLGLLGHHDEFQVSHTWAR